MGPEEARFLAWCKEECKRGLVHLHVSLARHDLGTNQQINDASTERELVFTELNQINELLESGAIEEPENVF